jgi:CheY-like chemotaxis protein
MLEQVFDLFMQAGSGPRMGHGGLGIGLTLVRSLVELHGGSVEAESPGSGKGSVFRVRLPIAHQVATPPRAHPATLPHPARPGARVLIADDNRDAADSLQALLTTLGYDAHVVYAGDHALAAAAALRPDFALVDLGMPGTDGYETARRLRAQPWGQELVLVALTGWGQESDRHRSRSAGFDHHLVKPASLERLLAVLDAGPRGHSTDRLGS